MHVHRLRLPLPRLGRLSLLLDRKHAWQAVPPPVEPCVRGTASGSVQASLVCSVMHWLLAHAGPRHRPASLPHRLQPCASVAFDACPFVMSDAAAPYSRLMRLGACGFAHALHSSVYSRLMRRGARLCCCTALIVARGLLAGVLLGIGVQSEHRELGCGTSDVALPGMLLLRFGALMMCGGPAIGYGALV
jgi:hypothetical protein